MRQSVKRHLAAASFFVLLACLALYWPLFHAGTAVPGSEMTDYFHFNWSYWWIRHALSTPGLNVYETNFVMFPTTSDLALHTMSPFWFPLWAVTEPLIGTLAAMDVIDVVALALTGYAFFLLLRRERVSAGLALLGGAVLQLTPSLFEAVWRNTLHYLGFFSLPLTILIWGQVAQAVAGWRDGDRPWKVLIWALVMGLVFYAMIMVDYQYALYAAFLLGPYGVLTLIEARPAKSRVRLIGLGVLAVIVGVALLWVVGPLRYLLAFDRSTLAPPPAEYTHVIPFPGGYLWHYDNYMDVLSLGAFVLPATLISLIVAIILRRRAGHKPNSPITPTLSTLLPSPSLLAERGPGGEVNSRRWFWFALSILPLLLSAGASITIAGAEIPMPYRLLHPLLGGLFRSPDRFGTVFIIQAMLFVGLTWDPLLRTVHVVRIRPLLIALLVLAIFVDARLFQPMAIQPPLPHYAFYDKIGQEHGQPYDNEVVLEVPVAAGSGEYWVGDLRDVALQYYAITHGKRMVNGLIARVPVSTYWYLRTDDPMLSWLGQRRLLDPVAVEKQLRQRIFQWPIGYIVVHQDLIGMDSSTIQEILGYFNSLPDLLCPYTVEDKVVVYRTTWHPDGCLPRTPPEVTPGVYQITLGASGDEPFIGWGWHYPESVAGLSLRWTGQYPQAKIYADLPPGAYSVAITAQSFNQPRQLQLTVNDQAAALDSGEASAIVPVQNLQTFTFTAPAASIGSGKHVTFTLNYDAPQSPSDLGLSGDSRKLAVAVSTIRFTRLPNHP